MFVCMWQAAVDVDLMAPAMKWTALLSTLSKEAWVESLEIDHRERYYTEYAPKKCNNLKVRSVKNQYIFSAVNKHLTPLNFKEN